MTAPFTAAPALRRPWRATRPPARPPLSRGFPGRPGGPTAETAEQPATL